VRGHVRHFESGDMSPHSLTLQHFNSGEAHLGTFSRRQSRPVHRCSHHPL